jgi:hypothetical protein
MSEISLSVKLDYPPKNAVVKISNSSTLVQLRAAAAKAVETDDRVLGTYRCSATSYGNDVVECDKGTLSELGIGNSWTIFYHAPADLKPERRRKPKKGENKDEKTDNTDLYKGYTPQNALQKFQDAKSPKDKKISLEFIDIALVDIVKTAGWTKLSAETIGVIIQRDSLGLEEGPLFDALLTWGKAEAKRKDKSDNKDEMKGVLGDLLYHIRFPCMDVTTVASKVNPSGLLEAQQMLDLFTYLGTKNAGVKGGKPPSSLSKFKSVARVPRKKPDAFTWSTSLKHSSITLSDNGLTATGTSSNQSVAGDVSWEKGIHEFEMELKGTTGAYAMVGLVPSSNNAWNSGSHIGDSSFNGWALFMYSTWSTYRNGANASISGQTGQGPVVIGCRVDLDKGKCDFFRGGLKSGTNIGTLFHDVTGPVRPAVTLYQGTVSIRPVT